MSKKGLLFFFFIIILPTFAQFKSLWDSFPESVRNKNSFKRQEWFYRPRTNETGVYPKEHIEQQRKIEEAKVVENLATGKITTTSDLWTNIGPTSIDMSSSFIPHWGNVSGRVKGLDIDPTNPNIVYAGAASGGIWKTTDGGATWVDKSGGLSHLTFGAIAIDPNNTEVIYAGTGESMWMFNNVIFEGDGLYKSTNGGNSWTKIISGIGTQTQFSDIEVSPLNSNLILAALGSGNWNNAYPPNEGIWRSSDAGASWTRVINVQDGFDVAFHPTNSSLVYAASGNQNSSGGFFISTDAGITWNQSNSGLPSATSIGRIQFELSPSNPSIIYTLVYNSSALSGGRTTVCYKSTNGGVNWSQISSGVNIAGSYSGGVDDQGFYDLCLAVHPADPNTVFFGNVELSKTTNASTIAFVRRPGGTGAWDNYTHVDIHKIMFAPSNANIAYIGCDGGVFKSTNSGSSWFHVNNNISTIQFYRVGSHPTNASILFGGAQDNGNFSTANKGATSWQFVSSGDGMECFVDYINPNYIFVSTQYGNLGRSTNGGATWLSMISGYSNCAWLVPFWQHPTDPLKIYAGLSQRIYRSTNRGASWSALSGTFTSNYLTSVAQSPVTVSNMLAVASQFTTSPGVYKSTDEGVTWISITNNVTNAGFTGKTIQRVIADPVDANIFYLTRASFSSGMVIKTTDFGTTWTDISGNLPSVSANDLFIDPANTAHLYVGNDFGVYWSSNGGISWIKLSNQMPFVPVLDFSFFNNGGTRYLRAATHGRGVYELHIDSPLPVELIAFTASTQGDNILLNWSTATEINNHGFEIERSNDNGAFKKIAFVDGNGISNSTKYYSFTDKNASGFLSYRLKQIDNNGSYCYSDIIKIDAPGVKDFAVYQNYPNPFNPITSIKYKVPVESKVKFMIINALGEEVTTLFNDTQDPGIHEVVWDGQNYSSGVYFASINMNSTTGNTSYSKTIKMILNK